MTNRRRALSRSVVAFFLCLTVLFAITPTNNGKSATGLSGEVAVLSRGQVGVLDLRSGRVTYLTRILKPGLMFYDASLSPSGQLVAFDAVDPANNGRSGVYLASLTKAGTVRRLCAGWGPVWSPDGSSLAVTTGTAQHSHVLVVPVRDPRRARILARSHAADRVLGWLPSGKEIAFVRQWATGELADLDVVGSSGESTRTIARGQVSWNSDVAWSSSGSTLVFTVPFGLAYVGGNLVAIDRDDSRRSALTQPSSAHVDWNAQWSPDSRWIAFLRQKLNAQDIGVNPVDLYIVRPDGTQLRAVSRFPSSWAGATGLTWSPSGTLVAVNVVLCDPSKSNRICPGGVKVLNLGGHVVGSYANVSASGLWVGAHH